MMTKLREMTFIFIWILVFAFVALMVFEWGMDFTGRSGRSNVVGKIDGQTITIQEFQKALQNAYMQEKERLGQEPDEDRMRQLRDQVWEMFVQRVLFSKELAKRDIKVTDREVFLNLTQNPPQEIRQNPNFQTNGQFDQQKYQQALQNPEINWLPVENYYREVLPFQKLQEIVNSAVIVTEAEVKSDYIQNNQKAKIDYLYVPVSAFAKDSVQVTEDEIKNYYNENKDDFKVEEKRQVNYVLVSTAPTAEDTAKAYSLADEVLQQARSGADFSELADEYSEDPSVQNNHGDLGYFEKGRMVKPFSDAAFAAKVGEVVGPVKSQFGLHVIKVLDKKVENGVEKVHAAHVLIKINASALTLEDARETANNFGEMAKDEGFQIAADRLKVKIQQTPEFTKRTFIPGLGNMPSAIDWVFNADKGDVSGVYRNQQGYVVMQLSEISPAGYTPFDEVKDICKNRVEFEKHKKMAAEFAEKVQGWLNDGASFAQVAQRDESKTVVMDSTKQFTMAQPIPKIGMIPEVKAAAFSMEPGVVSPMLDTERGFYFIKVTERTPFNQEEFQKQKDQIRSRLMAQKSQRFFSQWYEKLKENADIEDNRDQFFTS